MSRLNQFFSAGGSMSKKYLVILLAVAFVIGAIGSVYAATGSALITQYGCTGCHGSISGIPTVSTNAGEVALINAGINGGPMNGVTSLKALTAADIQAIADYLVPPPATVACTGYTYSAWSACGSNGQQTTTVTGYTPAGCTGTPSTAAVLTQACTPPVTTCTSFTYNAWGACQSDSTQSRTVASSLPAGCTCGTPVLSQGCTYVPPVNACTSFTYNAWGACQAANTQSRTIASSLPAGCTGGSPLLTQVCNYVPPVIPPPSSGTMLVPTSQDSFVYDAVDQPVVSINPGAAKPIGVGQIAKGGGTVDLTIDVGPFDKPVNVSFFVYAPSLDSEEVYFVNSDKEFKRLSDTVDNLASSDSSHVDDNTPLSTKFKKLSFWKKNVTEVNENIYQGSVAPGYYALVLVVKSPDNDEDFYSWTTHIVVPKASTEY